MLLTVLSPKTFARLLAMLAVGAVGYAHAAVPATSTDATFMDVSIGKGQIVTVPGGMADVLIANPKIADVSALQKDKLYIVGTSIGSTNIMVLDPDGNLIRNFNVDVGLNVAEIQHEVEQLFPNEKDVRIRLIGKQIALTGLVSTPAVSQKIARLVAAHVSEMSGTPGGPNRQVNEIIENMMEVRGEQQVMLRVRIVEMSRSVLKELGSELSSFDPSLAVNGRGLRGSLTSNNDTGLTQTPFSVASLLFDTNIGSVGDINLLINLLERDNLANTLAEPNLTAISGEEAGFLAGGEFPVPAGRDTQGNISIEYKKFGVSLNFKPLVLSDDRVSLQLNTEVSSLNQAQGITLVDVQVPGLDVRRATTTVEMNSGGSLMIAGLLRSDNTRGLNGIPGIKNTPVLGDLLSSKSFLRNETELVVIVTPYLVQPYGDPNQAQAVAKSELDMLAPPPPPAGLLAPGKTGQRIPAPPVDRALLEDADEPKAAEVKINTPLNTVFSKNMKQIYGQKLKAVPPENQRYGYMMD